jgi:hypothetical protein
VIAIVLYSRGVDVERARTCRRCLGGGRERHGPDAGQTCPRCAGSGVRPDGWAYQAGDLPVRIGSIVETPPTPRSNGKPMIATVIGVDEPVDVRPFKRLLRVLFWGVGGALWGGARPSRRLDT